MSPSINANSESDGKAALIEAFDKLETTRTMPTGDDPRRCRQCGPGSTACGNCTGGPLYLTLMPNGPAAFFEELTRFTRSDVRRIYGATRNADPKAKAKRKAQRRARKANRR